MGEEPRPVGAAVHGGVNGAAGRGDGYLLPLDGVAWESGEGPPRC